MRTVPEISIDPRSSSPIYEQITDSLRSHLVEGTLKAGDVLPPVRQLATDLGIHFNTVAHAYRELAAEGWLELKRKRGALVLDRRVPRAAGREQQRFSLQRLRTLTAQLRAEGMTARQVAGHLRRLADLIEGEGGAR